jgi:hypothetical protein
MLQSGNISILTFSMDGVEPLKHTAFPPLAVSAVVPHRTLLLPKALQSNQPRLAETVLKEVESAQRRDYVALGTFTAEARLITADPLLLHLLLLPLQLHPQTPLAALVTSKYKPNASRLE